MVLPLLPCPEYGAPSIALMLEGGEGGRPVSLLVINTQIQTNNAQINQGQ